MTTVVQVKLRSDDRVLTCWIEPLVRVGNRVTLKNHEEPQRQWTVTRVGEPRPSGDIKRGWSFDLRR